MPETVFIGKRGTITLPKKVRDKLGLKDGGVLILDIKGDILTLRPASVFPTRIYSEEEAREYIEQDFLMPGEKEEILKKWRER